MGRCWRLSYIRSFEPAAFEPVARHRPRPPGRRDAGGPLLGGPPLQPSTAEVEIRTTRDIWREQSVLMRQLLQGHGLLAVDSVLGWRYRSDIATAHDQTNSRGLR